MVFAQSSASLGIQAEDYADVARLVQRGLRYGSVLAFHDRSGLGWSQLSTLLRLPERTLARRRKAGRLSPQESDRLVRVAQIFERIVRLFDGDTAAARAWLLAPCTGFNDEPPLSMLDTEIGAVEVERLLGRLEHGVFS